MKNKKQKAKRTKAKIRKGDSVVVIAGNYRGQNGLVLKIDEDRITVQGVNVRKKHMRKSQTSPQGGIVEMEKPIHISNVMAVTKEGKGVRLKAGFTESGEKKLVYRAEGEDVILRSVKR